MTLRTAFLSLFAIGLLLVPASGSSRIADLIQIEGAREHQLVGFGLVVGLAGDGDRAQQTIFTRNAIANMLRRFGMNVDPAQVRADNTAAVMITAQLPPFLRPGATIDVHVASIGDANSLQGGVLLQTPLLGADENIYAVAQGAVTIGGFIQGGAGASVQRNHPTSGMIPNGAMIERELPASLSRNGTMNLMLRNPDYRTASNIAEVINGRYPNSAVARDPSTVNVLIPDEFQGYETNFVAFLGALEVRPNVPARVVINERTGTIVATSDVRISEVAISHGGLTIRIAATPFVSQPPPFSLGQTIVGESLDVDVAETQAEFIVIEEQPTIQQLTSVLNTLGVSNRDMIAILQNLKRAGALQAELIVN